MNLKFGHYNIPELNNFSVENCTFTNTICATTLIFLLTLFSSSVSTHRQAQSYHETLSLDLSLKIDKLTILQTHRKLLPTYLPLSVHNPLLQRVHDLQQQHEDEVH